MLTEPVSGLDERNAELLPVGDDAWVACDPTLDAHDARRVLAYLDFHPTHISVTWVCERRPDSSFVTMGEALQALSAAMRNRV